MKEYVLILPIVSGSKEILLVEKTKPEWQKGKLNLLGGAIEEGETPEQAAIRELKEESGLYLQSDKAIIAGKIINVDYIVYCLYCEMDRTFYYQKLNPRECEVEKVDWYDWDNVKHDSRLIQNLRVIIPLLRMRSTGWLINDTGLNNKFEVWVNV